MVRRNYTTSAQARAVVPVGGSVVCLVRVVRAVSAVSAVRGGGRELALFVTIFAAVTIFAVVL